MCTCAQHNDDVILCARVQRKNRHANGCNSKFEQGFFVCARVALIISLNTIGEKKCIHCGSLLLLLLLDKCARTICACPSVAPPSRRRRCWRFSRGEWTAAAAAAAKGSIAMHLSALSLRSESACRRCRVAAARMRARPGEKKYVPRLIIVQPPLCVNMYKVNCCCARRRVWQQNVNNI